MNAGRRRCVQSEGTGSRVGRADFRRAELGHVHLRRTQCEQDVQFLLIAFGRHWQFGDQGQGSMVLTDRFDVGERSCGKVAGAAAVSGTARSFCRFGPMAGQAGRSVLAASG